MDRSDTLSSSLPGIPPRFPCLRYAEASPLSPPFLVPRTRPEQGGKIEARRDVEETPDQEVSVHGRTAARPYETIFCICADRASMSFSRQPGARLDGSSW